MDFTYNNALKINLLTLVMCLLLTLVMIGLIYVIRNFRHNINNRTHILNAVFKTEERERDRIAKDLHDNLGALLSTIKLHAGTMRHITDNAEVNNINDDIIGLVDNTIIELRNIIKNILPTHIVNHGWLYEIEQMKGRIERSGSLKINLTNQRISRYRPDVEMNLYRIMQELINNVIKHANATTINIQVIENKDMLYIKFEDNGKGFDISTITTGIGSQSIESRVKLYLGNVELKSQPYLGTMYNITFFIKNFN
jgi:signal transduction histidine kinase